MSSKDAGLNWFAAALRWGGYGLVVVFLLFLVDLYFFQIVVRDPGFYVVARRSDTPGQVTEALRKLDAETVSDTEFRVLVDRYRRKMNGDEISPESRKKWRRAYRRTRDLMKEDGQLDDD